MKTSRITLDLVGDDIAGYENCAVGEEKQIGDWDVRITRIEDSESPDYSLEEMITPKSTKPKEPPKVRTLHVEGDIQGSTSGDTKPFAVDKEYENA